VKTRGELYLEVQALKEELRKAQNTEVSLQQFITSLEDDLEAAEHQSSIWESSFRELAREHEQQTELLTVLVESVPFDS
jgi:chromosome segregation ATPase